MHSVEEFFHRKWYKSDEEHLFSQGYSHWGWNLPPAPNSSVLI